MLTVSKIRSRNDIVACASMYKRIYNEDKLVVDLDKSINSLGKAASRGFLRVVLDNGVIVAWLLASEQDHPWLSYKILQQSFFASETSKLKTVKCVQLLHSEMESYAKHLGYDYVFSTGSHQDESFVFARILEKSGWQREGYLVFKKLR